VLARQGRQQLLEEALGEVLVEEVEVVLAAVRPEILGAILWQGVDLVALLLLILPVGPADRAGLVVGFLQKGRHLNPMDPVAVGVLSLLAFWGDFALAGFLGSPSIGWYCRGSGRSSGSNVGDCLGSWDCLEDSALPKREKGCRSGCGVPQWE
jgi:hypothetical protein